jgi:hypothetical protein
MPFAVVQEHASEDEGNCQGTLQKDAAVLKQFEEYAVQNGFGNIDYLLEQMIYRYDAFQTLVIIDELEDELDGMLRSSSDVPGFFGPVITGEWRRSLRLVVRTVL